GKRRRWRGRLGQEEGGGGLARGLGPGADFRFVPDWPDYAEWTLARLVQSHEFVWTAERADDWRKPWPQFTSTRYEAKAKQAGRAPCYLVFRRAERALGGGPATLAPNP